MNNTRRSFVIRRMAITVYLFLVAASCVTAAVNQAWPASVARCSINDPNLDQCLLKFTQKAIPEFAKGFPKLGIKSLDPLKNANFSFATPKGPLSVKIFAHDVSVYGPSKIQLRKVSFDKKTSTYWIEGVHNFLKMTGKYTVEGSVLFIPLNSAGSFEFEVRDSFANHSLKIDSNLRDASHGAVDFKMKTFKSMKLNLQDKRLGVQGSNAINKLVNDNWNLIVKTLWTPMENVVRDVYSDALRPLMKKFTVKDFFPVTP